jgi:hypothetical protein
MAVYDKHGSTLFENHEKGQNEENKHQHLAVEGKGKSIYYW